MANYSSLKSAVTSVIKTNGNKEITGAVLQSTLLAIINSFGDGFLFKGVATTSTDPGTPDQNVAYLAGPGVYTNFNNLEVPSGRLGVLKYNGSWAVSTIQVGGGDASIIDVHENGFFVVDNSLYIGFQVTENGIFSENVLPFELDV